MKVLNILPFFMAVILSAQTEAFKNFGNIQMHDNASIGFHTDLINDGQFDDNLGFTGFYSDSEIRVVSGNNRAIFNDVEIDAINNLQLNTSLGIKNELEFVNGKVITPRNNVPVSLYFIRHNFYVGEDDDRHTDGYTSVISTNEFIFPIGDDNRFRPMITPNQNNETYFNGAYFFEDPNFPSTFSDTFETSEKQVFINNISTYEFWDLDCVAETTVTLTWDTFSNIENIATELNYLRVVGWSKTEQKWVNLGNTNVSGNLTTGNITSEKFIPNQYEIITIGSIFPDIASGSDNFLMSPNGDDVNDALVFEGLEIYNQNTLTVFNRWGNVVYEVTNYNNDWKGISNGRATIKSSNKLPTGTYFYIIKFGNDNTNNTRKGWIYIN